tara:strand:- start:26666 stop:27358 length:693 start_codon:yes stop_codon:yes gene_type:complete
MKTKHIFFDLDRTLWDFETNSNITLLELFNNFNLESKGISNADEFINIYKINNERLWAKYREGRISQKYLRSERFHRALLYFGINEESLAEDIGQEYVRICPRKENLLPYSLDILDYLRDKYSLHIITNGFHNVQHIKLKHSRLSKYFDTITTSESVGVMKPNPKIFEYALNAAGACKGESVYIGDDLVVDIIGCQDAGIEGVYFNLDNIDHCENVAFEINCLNSLKELF